MSHFVVPFRKTNKSHINFFSFIVYFIRRPTVAPFFNLLTRSGLYFIFLRIFRWKKCGKKMFSCIYLLWSVDCVCICMFTHGRQEGAVNTIHTHRIYLETFSWFPCVRHLMLRHEHDDLVSIRLDGASLHLHDSGRFLRDSRNSQLNNGIIFCM